MVRALAQEGHRQACNDEHGLDTPFASVVNRRLHHEAVWPLAQGWGTVDDLLQARQATCCLRKRLTLLELVLPSLPGHCPVACRGRVECGAEIYSLCAFECSAQRGHISGVACNELHTRRQRGQRTCLCGLRVSDQCTHHCAGMCRTCRQRSGNCGTLLARCHGHHNDTVRSDRWQPWIGRCTWLPCGDQMLNEDPLLLAIGCRCRVEFSLMFSPGSGCLPRPQLLAAEHKQRQNERSEHQAQQRSHSKEEQARCGCWLAAL
mmetsp:Transcript_82675/g.192098  ORF Transcript_82675/g.192098 Transcript_82675/m.192098 type:complete len:262 (-) Transcript_82675:321-1106(-)